MADITNLLNQIKMAVKGEDVRGAIHDAIEQCYTDGQWDVQVGSSGHGLVDKLARDKIDQYISGSTGQMNEVRLYPLPGNTDSIYCEMPFTLKEDPLEYDIIRVYYKVVATSNEQIFQFKSSQFAADPTVITGCYFKKEDETLKVKRINIKHTEESPAFNPTSYIAYDVGIWSWSGAAADPATSYEVDGVSIDQSDPYPAGQITKITGIRFTTVEEAAGNIIGDKDELETTDKTNIVAAINELVDRLDSLQVASVDNDTLKFGGNS